MSQHPDDGDDWDDEFDEPPPDDEQWTGPDAVDLDDAHDADMAQPQSHPASTPTSLSAVPVVNRPATTARPPADPRYKKSIPAALSIATVVASVLVSCVLLALRSAGRPHVAAQDSDATTQISVVAAPPTTDQADPGQDKPIPYTATPHGCSGSAAALSVGATDLTRPWVCVLGGNIGQYLDLDLGRTMVVTGLCITPGWAGADASGVDQWPLHRVATRLQWNLDDNPPIDQPTGSVHGPACKPMPGRGLLAAHITMLVQETSRPPTDTSTTPTTGELLDGILPDPGTAPSATEPPALPAETSPSDPVDNTFAVSSVQVFGYSPTT